MRNLDAVYGTHALEEYERRVQSGGTEWQNLKDTEQSTEEITRAEPHPVRNYRELVKVLSFLQVMNKKRWLLFRGQIVDSPLLPTLARPRWHPDNSEPVDLTADRLHYWRQLSVVEAAVQKLLLSRGVPRWRPFATQPAARWAVIQHYNLWPTPLLDVTTSPRVAATFAFRYGFHLGPAYLYVLAADRVRSDLMAREDDDLDTSTAPTSDRPSDDSAGTPVAIRLSAVCPPESARPHLQEGYLLGLERPTERDLTEPGRQDLKAVLVAKLILLNTEDEPFWDGDFPMLSKKALMPDEEHDPLLPTLRTRLRYEREASGLLFAHPFG